MSLKLLSEEVPAIDQTRFIEFVQHRIENGLKPIAVGITRVGLHTFSNRSLDGLRKVGTKLDSAKTNAMIITKMSLTLKAPPDVDIIDFFRCESQPELLSLSDH